MTKKVSLKDIANKVGVSTALVSYVLNGQEKEKRVGVEIARKILKVAKELNYKPNQIARSLRKGSTKTIGLIVADIANPFFGYLARFIEDEANKYGYTVIFGSSDESNSKSAALTDILINRQVDGFIIVPTEGSEDQIKNLIQRNIPFILIDRFFPELSTSYITLDNYSASNEATRYLLKKGYKRIGIIAYKSKLIHMQERIAGYVDAIASQKNNYGPFIKEIRFDNVEQDIENAINDLVIKNKKIDALFFATNSLSIAGLYCICKYGIKVPDELALVGFDGNESFDFFYSPLTYVEQPISEMGKESVRVLVDLIDGKDKIIHIELKHKLIIRKSCG
ncbi:MAG TPA: substrate-binding domain-containing protein [Bacteroidales bacterium]